MIYLAQNLPDISSVEPAFVKAFLIMGGFVLVAWLLMKKGSAPSGGRDEPLHLGQPVEIRKAVDYATKEEVGEVRETVQALREENNTQHHATITAGEKRVTDLSRVMDQETAQITGRIDTLQKELMDKMEQNFLRVFDKLEKVSTTVAEHGAELKGVDKRMGELSERYTQSMRRVHERIDDAMQASRTSKKA